MENEEIKALNKSAETIVGLVKDTSVRFAEWIERNYTITSRSAGTCYYVKEGLWPKESVLFKTWIKEHGKTTSELFDIFLAEETLRLRSVEQERLENTKEG